MCKFSSKSGGVPFQILFFLGDLTRNDPNMNLICKVRWALDWLALHLKFGSVYF